MNLTQVTLGHRIADAVRDFEERLTHHGREWIAVFLNEATVVIAVHGSLTAAESALAGNPTGYAQLLKSQRRLVSGLRPPMGW
jgi:uncharacterized protein YbcI